MERALYNKQEIKTLLDSIFTQSNSSNLLIWRIKMVDGLNASLP